MPAPDALSVVDLWRRLGMQIRLGPHPDDARLLARYLSCGEALAQQHGCSARRTQECMLTLLIQTARDAVLPIGWRLTCLDACRRPMEQLADQVREPADSLRLMRTAKPWPAVPHAPMWWRTQGGWRASVAWPQVRWLWPRHPALGRAQDKAGPAGSSLNPRSARTPAWRWCRRSRSCWTSLC
jgi:hypothetical protein